MKNNIITEITIALTLAAFVGLLLYAQKAWMPDMATMLVLVLIVVCFAVFTIFVWKERGGDEREIFIRHIGARSAFLAAGVVLLLGIIVETLTQHTPDPWLGIALVVMVSAKIIGHAYGRKKY